MRNENEFSHLGLYSASKAALDHFSKELRHEVKADRIMVTVLSCGAVATGSVANFDPAALGEAMKDWLTKGPKFDGAAQAETMGEAIAALLRLSPGRGGRVHGSPSQHGPMPKMLESADWKQDQAGA